MKIVINKCYGGFGLSDFGKELLNIRDENSLSRTNLELIHQIEEYGSDVISGDYSQLKVIEIPDGIDYEILNHDGLESVHETHRVWR